MGRTRTNRLTFFAADPGDGRRFVPGDLVDVAIEAVRPFSLRGRPLGRGEVG
jgi:tRNA-2-methylthio-N6-dimethylallyladenosine synthase